MKSIGGVMVYIVGKGLKLKSEQDCLHFSLH